MTRQTHVRRTMTAGTLLLAFLAACGQEDAPVRTPADNPAETPPTDTSAPPWAGYVADPNIYTAEADPARIIEETSPEGLVSRFPSNQVLVLMNEGVPRSTVERLAADVAGTIVGQIPDDGFYQIELATSTLAELDSAIERLRADPDVAAAGRSTMGRLAQACPAENDNAQFDDADRCAFGSTEYYQAITMFEFFRPHLTLHRVTVGIVDTGVDVSTGEFAVSRLLNMNEPGTTATDTDPEGHGTAVTGLIAAEDNGRGINGLASRFLGDRLYVAVSTMGEDPQIQPQICIASVVVLANAGAQVINCSIGWPESDPTFDVILETWRRVMRRRSNILFVVAAGHETTELTGRNYAPGGIDLPNVITVGGFALCRPDTAYSGSNFGAGVNIAAPAESVPVTSRDGGFRLANGTSFATPQVTALAAVLKSIRPALSAADLKRRLVANAQISPAGAARAALLFTGPIMQLLIDMDVPDPVRSWLDPMGLGDAGPSGLVLSRVCPAGVSYTVDEYGSFSTYTSEHGVGIGTIGTRANPPVVSVPAALPDEAIFSVGSSTLTDFALGTYVVSDEPGSDNMMISFRDTATLDGGLGIAGSVTLDSCRIEERNPFNGVDPWIVRLSGTFEGVLEMGHSDGRDPTYHQIDGYFSMPMLVPTPDEALFEYLEIVCEGGIPQTE